MRIYLTYCSARKLSSLKGTGKKVTPDKLYISSRIRRFMRRCRTQGVRWAIFSDRYGVYFPTDKHDWYEKPPSDVNEEEYSVLVRDFDRKLKRYVEIWFYYHPARFHRLYKRLLRQCRLRRRVKRFTRLSEIVSK